MDCYCGAIVTLPYSLSQFLRQWLVAACRKTFHTAVFICFLAYRTLALGRAWGTGGVDPYPMRQRDTSPQYWTEGNSRMSPRPPLFEEDWAT